MRRTASALLAGALALGAVATTEGEPAGETAPAPAHVCSTEDGTEPVYTEQQVWFHEGDSKLANGAAAPWDTEPPTAAVTDGAGAGAVSGSDVVIASTAGQESVSAVFAGTFEGCMDTLLFDLYSFDPTNRSGTGGTAEPATQDFSLRVTVDGTDLMTAGPLAANTTHVNEGAGPNLHQFAVDIGALMEQYAGFGLVQLNGEHEIEIEVAGWYVNTQAAVVYVWDTTEVPAGLTFNGEVTEDYPVVG